MDTSELAERFFDENEVFYSADARNKIVFNVEEKEEKDEKEKQEEQETNETSSVEESVQSTQEETGDEAEDFVSEEDEAKNELINEFVLFKQNNPQGTLQDFYVYLANKIKKESNG